MPYSAADLPPFALDGTPKQNVLAGLCNAAFEEGIARCELCPMSCKTGDRLALMLGYERVRKPIKQQKRTTYYNDADVCESRKMRREETERKLLAARDRMRNGEDVERCAKALGYKNAKSMMAMFGKYEIAWPPERKKRTQP